MSAAAGAPPPPPDGVHMPELPTDAADVDINLAIAILRYCITRITSTADEVDGVANALNADVSTLILGDAVVRDTTRTNRDIARLLNAALAKGTNGMFPERLITMASRLRSADHDGEGAELQDATSHIRDAIDEFQVMLSLLRSLRDQPRRSPPPGRGKRARTD